MMVLTKHTSRSLGWRGSREALIHVHALAVTMVIRPTFGDRLVPRWRPDWRIDDAPLVYLDLETTGLHPERGHRITEIGLIDRGGIRLHLQPGEDPSTDDEQSALMTLIDDIRDKVVVGHHIPFDLRFLAARAGRLGLSFPTLGFVDTLGLARLHLDLNVQESSDQNSGLPTLELATVARFLNLDLPKELHRAIPDARLCRRVLQILIDQEKLQTLKDLRVRRLQLHPGS